MTLHQSADTSLAQLEDELQAALADVERRLETAITSDQPIITEMGGHLLAAGGKRIRPQLVVLASRFGDYRTTLVLTAAVVCELTHLASLYHDDVMDEAHVRRGVDSANYKWGNTLAILTGDYLFSQASDLGSSLGEEMSRLHSKMTKRLVAGQIRETVGPLLGQDPMRHYVRVTQDKTGALISSACQLGAYTAKVDAKQTAALSEYGEALGVAFQYSDDILDVTARASEFGKQVGQDLREGIPSLPVLHAKKTLGPGDEELRQLLEADLSEDEAGAQRALDLLREHQAIEASRADLREVVDRALASLEDLEDCPARTKLAEIASSMIDRTV